MAIRAGQAVWENRGFVIDRAQTIGADSLNIPEETVYEVGNDNSVAIVRDTPDLSFGVESWDVVPEFEALLLSLDPTALSAGQKLDLGGAVPIDMLSPWRKKRGDSTIFRSIIFPALFLESVTYRLAIRQNAVQQFGFRGDSIYYVPGSAFAEQFTSNGVGKVFTLANTAIRFTSKGQPIYVLGLCYVETDGSYRRLFHGVDYTDTPTGFTLTTAAPNGAVIRAVYGSTAASTRPSSVNASSAVKPAALRHPNFDIYLGSAAASLTLGRWDGVTAWEGTRRANLDADDEFGNPQHVSQDYDTAEVSGSITLRSRDLTAFWNKLHQITGVSPTEIVGTNLGLELPMEARLSHPDTGALLKTIYVPDAVIQVPAPQTRANTKVDLTLPWKSSSGQMHPYNGARS